MGEDSPGTPGLLPLDTLLTGRAPFPVPSPSCRDLPASAGSQDLDRSLVCSRVCMHAKSLSHVQLSAPPWTAACQAPLSFTISWSLLKSMSIESVMPSNQLILYHPLLLLPSIFPSIRFTCTFA